MKKTWPFSFYFLYFAAFASLLPFLVIFYQELGFSGAQIGLLTGVPPLITLFCAPFGAGLADSTRRHKLIMGIGISAAIIIVLLLPLVKRFAAVFILIALFNIFISPVSSLSDSGTMTMLGEERSKYGRIRLGGFIGGLLLESIGGRGMFFVLGIVILVGLALLEGMRRLIPEKVVLQTE